MKNSDRVLIGLGLGILAGGVAGYFLATDEGKKMRHDASLKLKEYNTQLQNTVKEQSERMAEKLDEVSSKAKVWVDDVSATVKNKINSSTNYAEDSVDDAEESFKAGVERARHDINEKLRTIDEVVDNA